MLPELRFSWLDFKLGFRMLARYPGLTLVGGLAIAFGIAVGTFGHAYVSVVTHPRLGLPNADRIVGLQLWDAETNAAERRTLHDFALWRAQLRSVMDLGAAWTTQRRRAALRVGGTGPSQSGMPLRNGTRCGGGSCGAGWAQKPPALAAICAEGCIVSLSNWR